MLSPASSEFIALCRAQIMLLTQGLGASLSVVYLTQQLVEGDRTQLVPIVTYPETDIHREWTTLLMPDAEIPISDQVPQLLADSTTLSTISEDFALASTGNSRLIAGTLGDVQARYSQPDPVTSGQQADLVTQLQLVLPLIHENVVFGFLLVARNDRAWSEWEHTQIEKIADTIALACILDQRYQWLEHDRQQQQVLLEQQHDMLDNLLHQFRNSLTALQTFGKLILKRLLPEDPNREIASSIVRETNRLKELAQQLEAVTAPEVETPASVPLLPVLGDRLSAHATDSTIPQDVVARSSLQASSLLVGALPLESCSVEAILKPLLASAATIAQDRNLAIHAALPDYLPPIWANPQALREVLNNLIENALKYTPEGGEIVLQASQAISTDASQQDWVEIEVSDTGLGIPPQDLPHIFERHYRGVQAQTDIPGTGLGLAIAKVLTEQMHGEIQVFSPARTSHFIDLLTPTTRRGAGTTFVVRLSVRQEQPT